MLTIAVFARYLSQHTNVLHQLARTPLSSVAWLLLLDTFAFGTLVLLLGASLRVYGKRLARRENFLLSAYSSLVNFFGPGQSGPAVRGAYLKKRVGLRLKQYAFATLIYYGYFAILSGVLVVAGLRPWWQTALAFIVISAGGYAAFRQFGPRQKDMNERHLLSRSGGILLATLLQMLSQVLLYAVELHTVDRHVSVGQILTYTGVANFALFVALTPGAIGIRESFLVFSERLHHITSSAIVSANLLDRAVYILFLGVLFILVLTMHAKQRLRLRQLDEKPTQE